MSFVTGSALKRELRLLFDGQRVDLAVAYWGNGAADLLGLAKASQGSRIICDAFGGACNPDALADLLKRGFAVRDLPGLHSKVYLAGDTMVVGSANASSNGLGQEGVELNLELEASLVSTDPSQIAIAEGWFERVYRAEIDVTPRDIPFVRSAWLRNRDARPVGAAKTKRLRDLLVDKGKIEHFKDRRFVVTINKPATPLSKNVGKLKSQGFSTEHFWDYPELAAAVDAGDTILSFEIGKGKIEKGRLWKVQAVIEKGTLIPVQEMRSYLGLSHTLADGAILHQILMDRLAIKGLSADSTPMTIYEFAVMVSS